MTWGNIIWLIARVALRVLADELDPAGRRRRPKGDASRARSRKDAKKDAPRPRSPEPKQAPPQPRKAPSQPKKPAQAEPTAPYAAPQSAESAGWGASGEPQPVPVIRIETDTGSTISPLSVLGNRAYVAPRAQRERKPGESRRVRRTARAEDSIPEPTPQPRSPEMTACIERMRARASTAAVPPQHDGEQLPEREQGRPMSAASEPPMPAKRRRPPGEPLSLTQLAPATLLLLQRGEPQTDAAWAA